MAESRFVVLLTMALSAASLPAAAHAASKSVEGCWRVRVEMPFPISDRKFTACFKKDGGSLVGKVRRKDGGPWKAATEVSQSGDRVRFAISGKDGKVTFEGSWVTGSKLKGKMTAPKATRPFGATRTTRSTSTGT